MPRSDGLRILGDFWKKAVSWDLRLDEASWFSGLGEARPGQLGLRDAPRVVGSDGTVSIVEIVSLSPRVENLKIKKVIKVSYLNYRESSVFRDSLCIFHIFISWSYFGEYATISVTVIVIINGTDDPSSNSRRSCLRSPLR